ncbi:Uncharacterised protein [Mycobacteroides abscessus subsp. massiliense]|nr:Uncharacterised protein [Mycobacteroides abscessus subsp. massiliense]
MPGQQHVHQGLSGPGYSDSLLRGEHRCLVVEHAANRGMLSVGYLVRPWAIGQDPAHVLNR